MQQHVLVNAQSSRSLQQRRHHTCMTATQTGAAATRTVRRLEPLKPDEVFYFAYGSNMNPKVLTGRRFVKPKESWPCSVPDHVLSFAVQGMPYSEPGFATIIKRPQQLPQQGPAMPQQQSQQQPWQHQQPQWQQSTRNNSSALSASTAAPPCVHGVLHRVTKREWRYIQATEGVGSEGIGYQVIAVNCHLYDGETVVQAHTLQAAEPSLHGPRRQVLPSQRYLQLLQEGGNIHNLDQQYQQWLGRMQHYQPNQLQRVLGTAASGAVLLSAAAPAVPVYIASRALGMLPTPGPAAGTNTVAAGQAGSPGSAKLPSEALSSSGSSSDSGLVPYLRWYVNAAQSFTWALHDTALAPVLGSGCSNDKPQ